MIQINQICTGDLAGSRWAVCSWLFRLADCGASFRLFCLCVCVNFCSFSTASVVKEDSRPSPASLKFKMMKGAVFLFLMQAGVTTPMLKCKAATGRT